MRLAGARRAVEQRPAMARAAPASTQAPVAERDVVELDPVLDRRGSGARCPGRRTTIVPVRSRSRCARPGSRCCCEGRLTVPVVSRLDLRGSRIDRPLIAGSPGAPGRARGTWLSRRTSASSTAGAAPPRAARRGSAPASTNCAPSRPVGSTRGGARPAHARKLGQARRRQVGGRRSGREGVRTKRCGAMARARINRSARGEGCSSLGRQITI